MRGALFIVGVAIVALLSSQAYALDLVLVQNFSFVGSNHSCQGIEDVDAFDVDNTLGFVEKTGDFGTNLVCPHDAYNFTFVQMVFDFQINDTEGARFYITTPNGSGTGSRDGDYYAIENQSSTLNRVKEIFGNFDADTYPKGERIELTVNWNITAGTANFSVTDSGGTANFGAHAVDTNSTWEYWAWTPAVDIDPHRVWGVYIYALESEVGPATPSLNTPAFDPSTVYTNTDVNISSTYTDVDGDTGTVFMNVTVDGTTVSSKTMTGLSDGDIAWIYIEDTNYTKGQNISAYFNATDADGNSTSIISNSLIVSNRIPTYTFAGSNDTNISYSLGVWNISITPDDVDNDTVNITKLWYIGASLDRIMTNSSIANGTRVDENFTFTSSAVGQYVNVTFNVTDGEDTSVGSAFIFIVDDVNPIFHEFVVLDGGVPATTGEEDKIRTLRVNVSDALAIDTVVVEIYRDLIFVTTKTMSLSSGFYVNTYDFPTPGSYTFTVNTTDTSGNVISNSSGVTFTATQTETPGGGGGGGGGNGQTTIIIVDGETITFDVEPIEQKIVAVAGSTTTNQIRIINKGTTSISISAHVDEQESSPRVKGWLTFEGFERIENLTVPVSGGLTSNVKFLTYQIRPDGEAPLGEYTIVLNVETFNITRTHTVVVEVQEGFASKFLLFWDKSLWDIRETLCSLRSEDNPCDTGQQPISLKIKHVVYLILACFLIYIIIRVRQKNRGRP